MKIYTKTGDSGTTSLYGGTRVPKHHARMEALGALDELNSWLGLINDQEISESIKETLLAIQHKLFEMGAMVATEPKKEAKSGTPVTLFPEDSTFLELKIDEMNTHLPEMTHFILPGGHTTVSYCHIARTVCRRAERAISYVHEETPINQLVLQYINRLSDYLFVLARKLTSDLQRKEIKWIPKKV